MHYLDDETGVIHYDDEDLEYERSRELREERLHKAIDARITWQPR